MDVADKPVQDPAERTDIRRLYVGHCPRGEDRLGVHVLEREEGRVNSKPSRFFWSPAMWTLFKMKKVISKNLGMDNIYLDKGHDKLAQRALGDS